MDKLEAKKTIERALDDVEADLFYEIKTRPGHRDALLSQLDALSKLKDRVNARFDRTNPAS